jgi:hypothetical protein
MKLSLPQKVLLSMGVVAGLGVLAGAGTFATFTAQTTNPDNVFANGTLVLSNEVDSLGACLSTGAGTDTDDNENEACDTVFDLAVRAPGDSDTTNLTLKNMGSLAASDLVVFSGSCTDSDAADEDYNGSGSPCAKVQIYIQEWTTSARNVPATCLYGGTTIANTCDFSDDTKTLATFVSDHTDLSEGLSAGGLAALGGADTTWITIGVMLPSDADNTFQGRAASLALNWHITQV